MNISEQNFNKSTKDLFHFLPIKSFGCFIETKTFISGSELNSLVRTGKHIVR